MTHATSNPLGVGIDEPVDRHGAFPRLDIEQRARLREVGDVCAVKSGEVLFREGAAGYDFFVVESCAVAILEGSQNENRVIVVHGPHGFLDEPAGSTCWSTTPEQCDCAWRGFWAQVTRSSSGRCKAPISGWASTVWPKPSRRRRAYATGRFTTPEEVASLITMLVSGRTANVTGVNYVIDGGLIKAT